MKRLTTDNPQGNFETMLNYAYDKDEMVALRFANGEEDVDLCEYVAKEAAKLGCICSAEDILDGGCFGCLEDCLPSVLYTVACQAAILRATLKEYEDTNLMPDEVLELKAMLQGTEGEHSERWKRLQELETADKDGRIVILPAKTVYELVVDAGPSCDMKCPPELFTDDYGCPCCDFCDKGEIIVYERDCRQDDVRQIGNTLWLTREEAEAEIKARKGGAQ